jgi:probable HAF family extracellular repeat protein
MKRSGIFLFVVCLGLLFAASTCFAQMYTLTDLGPLLSSSGATGINASGQVVGDFSSSSFGGSHAFRTAANSPINPATDDLGTFGTFSSLSSGATGINASGQVVGFFYTTTSSNGAIHAFRTAANSPINPATDDLGTLGGLYIQANGINDSGQVVGFSETTGNIDYHAFRTAANSPINPATDDLGTLGGSRSEAYGINASGQVVGWACTGKLQPPTGPSCTYRAFCTAANSPINPATDDLGTLGGDFSFALGINASGQVVGYSYLPGNLTYHAFLYSGGVMYDLNDLIPAGSSLELLTASGINDAGQIAASRGKIFGGKFSAVLLTPIYKAFVQPPINPDGSSVFKASRGDIPVKFTLTQNGTNTCALPSATISVTRTAGGTLGPIGEGSYVSPADNGSNFRIDATDCQHIYNLAAKSLGVGTYRVDITVNGVVVGSAVFELQ